MKLISNNFHSKSSNHRRIKQVRPYVQMLKALSNSKIKICTTDNFDNVNIIYICVMDIFSCILYKVFFFTKNVSKNVPKNSKANSKREIDHNYE